MAAPDIDRLKSDGLERMEDRLGMFHNPHRMPIGGARAGLAPAQFAAQARPVLEQCYQHEQAVAGLFAEQAMGPGGMRSDNMRGLVQQRSVSHPREEWQGADQRLYWQQNALPKPRPQVQLTDHDERATRGAPVAGRRAGQQRLTQPSFLPSSAIIGANPGAPASWQGDRDQMQVQLQTDPNVLYSAAASAETNQRVCADNRLRSRQSVLAFGSYELNPGGHKLNANLGRADDFGIDRVRNEDPSGFGPPRGPTQVAHLLVDPDPRAPPPLPPSANNPHKGMRSNSDNMVKLMRSDAPVDPVGYNPHAGKRNQSIVFGEQSGPSGPDLRGVHDPNVYVGLDAIGGPTLKQNPYSGRIVDSKPLQQIITQDPGGNARMTAREHGRRRSNMPAIARRVPNTEEVVFHAPLTSVDANAVPPYEIAGAGGKKSIHDAKAAMTQITSEELGGMPEVPYEHPVYAPKGHYADNKQMLEYMEYADVPHDQMPHSPGIKKTAVGQAMTFGDVAPNAVSQEPKGLPRRHPGPDRLRRGRGVDGMGHDHHGRQLATSLVDEAVFGRSKMDGRIAMQNNGANFTINQQGEFGHR